MKILKSACLFIIGIVLTLSIAIPGFANPNAEIAMTQTPEEFIQSIKPFLTIPLRKKDIQELSQGWMYSPDEVQIHPDIKTHYGEDFQTKWGTPVYAPANGWAKASYHIYSIKNAQGQEDIGFGLGLFCQIRHDESRVYTVYAHLSRLGKAIPYVAPILRDRTWEVKPVINVSVEEFKKGAKFVRKGDIIGFVGNTGLGYGLNEKPSPNPKRFKTWDPAGPHLHWEAYTRTEDDSYSKDIRIPIFGQKSEINQYPDVLNVAHGLILANPDGSPQYAR